MAVEADDPDECSRCGGAGRIYEADEDTDVGLLRTAFTCPNCGGKGVSSALAGEARKALKSM